MGQRSLNFVNKLAVMDINRNLLSELVFNPNQIKGVAGLFKQSSNPIDQMEGSIYEVTSDVIQNIISDPKYQKSGSLSEKQIIKKISMIEGLWNQTISFDSEEFWNIEKVKPYPIVHEPFVLPSDSNFREDLLYLKILELDKASDAKIKIEK